MEALHETIQALRKQLRLAMNGVVSTSMREKGLAYKLNFGVSYPEIKQIAMQRQPDADLANALWQEDCRELKIIATLLQPTEGFTKEEALRWVGEAPYPEIAEFLSKHLLARLPYAEALMLELLRQNDSRLGRATAFLLWTECIKQGRTLSPATKAAMQAAALRQADSDASLFERRVAIQALRFHGRQQTDQAKALLEAIETRMKTHEEPSIWEDLYNDLKFEFDN